MATDPRSGDKSVEIAESTTIYVVVVTFDPTETRVVPEQVVSSG
jgi:hypothetical protein